jgi:hypothetical protein
LAESFDGGEGFVGGFCPFERPWVVVVALDEGADIGFELGDRTMDAALGLLAGEFGEPTLDLIDP